MLCIYFNYYDCIVVVCAMPILTNGGPPSLLIVGCTSQISANLFHDFVCTFDACNAMNHFAVFEE
jgi:hypothetical protein